MVIIISKSDESYVKVFNRPISSILHSEKYEYIPL